VKRAVILGVPIEDAERAENADDALGILRGMFDFEGADVAFLGISHSSLTLMFSVVSLDGSIEWLPEVGRAGLVEALVYDMSPEQMARFGARIPRRASPPAVDIAAGAT